MIDSNAAKDLPCTPSNTVEIEFPKPTEDLLTKIVNMANQQDELEKAVLDLEEQVKRKKKELADIQIGILPELMSQARLKSFESETGLKIEIKPGLYCKIPESKKDQAMTWLEDHNLGRIIQREISISFAKEDEDQCKKLIEEFSKREQPLDYKEIKNVHAATLKAQIKKILEDGKLAIPKDVFGIHEQSMAIINHSTK